MFLKQIHIKEFKALKNVHISLKQNDKSNVFSIASLNGLGKSTLLQFIFTMLHCSFDDGRKEYVKNLLEGLYPDILDDELLELAEFEIEDKKEIIQIGFVIVGNTHGGFNFDCFLDIPEIEEKLEELGELKSKLESLLKIQEEIR
ncbi:MAG: AAA family ATPase, partial [Methyloprofundus sp.]|nr:AAA family ATPase [Methyloprofundus sp.]